MKTLLIIFQILILLLVGAPSIAALNDTDRAEFAIKNLLAEKNPGFENKTSGWTASGGTLSVATSGSNFQGIGKVSGTWDSSGAGQTLTGPSYTITNGMAGTNGVLRCKVMTPSGTSSHTLGLWDGSTLSQAVTIPSSTVSQYVYINFIFGAAASTIAPRFTSVAADEPLVSIDDCGIFAADGLNLQNVSQASFIGSAYFPATASCTFTVTSTTLADMSDADCPGPTVELNPGPGTIQTTDADAPNVTVNSLPPGTYRVRFSGASTTSAVSPTAAFAISDGTNARGQTTAFESASGSVQAPFDVEGVFTYTSSGNRTFKLQAMASSGRVDVTMTGSGTRQLTFSIYRFPTTAEQAFRPDIGPSSWSGYHDSTCSWARTNTSYGDPASDASCALVERTNRNFGSVTGTNTLPQITFTPTRVGRFYVCAHFNMSVSGTGVTSAAKLWDGTTTIAEADTSEVSAADSDRYNLCGIYDATSTASKTLSIQTKVGSGSATIQAVGTAASAIEWSVIALDFSMNAPVLVGSVTNTGTNGMRFEGARINCDAGSATTAEINGTDWISGNPTNQSSGACTITINSGIFSAAPYCVAQSESSAPRHIWISSFSATSLTIKCQDTSGVDATCDYFLLCMGQR